ncbi:hypothetical protein [Thioclava electrotropha]|uniref:Ribbon-helix-helix protein CopG domain-containing protein n=1 Tax=Thioclava electrotropha TaxID=1549850 RepID=A0ABX6YVJ5_9RHOB|nr:hypothetical protein [Thioclava electrotropha]QPZ91896.1 hypothetical protein AKL02_014005 [Thioclava electrotropha]
MSQSASRPHSQHRLVSLRLPLDLIDRIAAEARAFGLPPAELIRRVLQDGLAEEAVLEASGAKAPLPEMHAVQEALDQARDWFDLQHRLRGEGFVLRLAGGGALGLHAWPTNRFLMLLDEIGPSLTELVLRFGAPFPGDDGGRTKIVGATAGRGASARAVAAEYAATQAAQAVGQQAAPEERAPEATEKTGGAEAQPPEAAKAEPPARGFLRLSPALLAKLRAAADPRNAA